MSYITRYEKEIIAATGEFAKSNGIPFPKMMEIMILNTIRTVKADDKRKIKQILQFAVDKRTQAKKMHKETEDKQYWEGEFVAAEGMILQIKELTDKRTNATRI